MWPFGKFAGRQIKLLREEPQPYPCSENRRRGVDGYSSIKSEDCLMNSNASQRLFSLQSHSLDKARKQYEISKLDQSPTSLSYHHQRLCSASTCPAENKDVIPPLLCSAPIKYQYVNSSPAYVRKGKGSLKFQLINQRSDFSFALFSGGLDRPKLVAVSNTVAFANPKAPVYPHQAQGREWNEMTVTWTSGYGIAESNPFVEWSHEAVEKMLLRLEL